MSRYTITPWRTQKDLLLVRQQLYGVGRDANSSSTTSESQRTAVSRILAWKLRGNLPHAVESTALLTDAVLHHNSATAETSSFSIRAVYSAAFTRFVTGFCDIGRSRERALDPRSMLDIARQIGMPEDFVALRHEATHDEMPGLKRLMDASSDALAWLWTVYWSRLEEPVDEKAERGEGSDSARDELGGLLKEFRRQRRDALRNGQKREVQILEIEAAATSCIERCGGSEQELKEVASCLVNERLLLPASRE